MDQRSLLLVTLISLFLICYATPKDASAGPVEGLDEGQGPSDPRSTTLDRGVVMDRTQMNAGESSTGSGITDPASTGSGDTDLGNTDPGARPTRESRLDGGNGDEKDDEKDDGDRDKDGLDDTGRGLGTGALVLLGLGSIFVIARQRPVQDWVLAFMGWERKSYAQMLRHLLTLHTVVMALATIAAVAHGVAMVDSKGWEGTALTGLLPLVVMVYLSLAGFVLRLKLSREILSRHVRKTIRLLHLQRLTTLLLLIGLVLHLGGGD